MRSPARRWIGALTMAFAAGFGATGAGVALAGPRHGHYHQTPPEVAVLLAVGFVAFAVLGILVVQRASRHLIGWLLVGAGMCFVTGSAAEAIAKKLAASHAAHGWAVGLSWVDSWAWSAALGLVLLTLLLFPHGAPKSRRFRLVAAAAVFAIVVQWIGTAFAPGRLGGGAHERNPLGIAGLKSVLGALTGLSSVLEVALLFVAVIGLVARYRRSNRETRQQIRWLALAAAATVVSVPLVALSGVVGNWIQAVPFVVAVVTIPAAMAVAILRYRLYDIDVVVNRAIVFLLLTALITTIYVAIVAGVGALAGGHRVALSVAAAALVAVVINPARVGLQRLADRAVFGRRATPYQVLTEFANRIAGEWATGELLPQMAQMLVDATGAVATAIYLLQDDVLTLSTSVPVDADLPRVVSDSETGPFDIVQLVRDRDTVLGALAVRKPPGARLNAADERLIGYLASHAGLMLGHAQLTVELERKIDDLDRQAADLRRSRERLVRAQDDERRRLERDLHDGAQQDLVAIIAKVSLARNQLGRGDVTAASATIDELQDDVRRALLEVRELARGIFPPVLIDRGLLPAIEARADRLPVPVQMNVRDTRQTRLPLDLETAAYFVVAEAFANILKHAEAKHVSVEVDIGEEVLVLRVRDDGRGLNGWTPGSGITGMSDRLAALGGELSLDAVDQGGTELEARLPLTLS